MSFVLCVPGQLDSEHLQYLAVDYNRMMEESILLMWGRNDDGELVNSIYLLYPGWIRRDDTTLVACIFFEPPSRPRHICPRAVTLQRKYSHELTFSPDLTVVSSYRPSCYIRAPCSSNKMT